ncbi:MAG: fimbrial protein [Alistipes sp.]|nr:fimbrial protein [Alistipes sp.]
MLNIRKISYGAVVAGFCLLSSVGCVKKDAAFGERHDVTVQLNIGTRAVEETDGKPTTVESAIHSLRVYAFVDGQLVGHEFRKGDMSASATLWVDLVMTTLSTETVDFYLVANEEAMSTPGNEKTLTENTSESELNNFTFTTLKNISVYGLPMFAKESREIDFSKLSNRQPTDPAHSGHTPLEQTLSFGLQRPVGKLGVFAAKEEGEAAELKITGLTMLEAGTRAFNYLMPQEIGTLKQSEMTGTGDIELTHSSDVVDSELASSITPEERENPKNYTAVLGAPFYPFENPWGSGDWSSQQDEHGNILQIDYMFGNDQRQGLVYMPAIERNKYYTVCCLMHNSGKITVAYDVADWEDGGNYDLEFDYPSYDLLQPFSGGSTPYAQPTVYYNSDASSTAGTYSFKFKIKGPVGQEWQPTLFDATAADYELSVYQKVDGVNTLVTPPYVASDTEYEIRVRALKVDNVNKEFSMGIAYTPKWDPSASSLLLINMLDATAPSNWQGSTSTEKIVIKQVDIPTN